jgi:hypothetical protein
MKTNTADRIEFEWSNGIGSRERRAWLLLIKGERVEVFTGSDVAGVVSIITSSFKKDGKWSKTTYRLGLFPGVRAISGMDGWETGKFIEGLRTAVSAVKVETWSDVGSALGVSVPAAMAFLRTWRPKAAEELDEVDAKLTALEDATGDAACEVETVTVSFGAPTRRMREEGYWTSPKSIPGVEGEVELVDTAGGWTLGNVRVTGCAGQVLSVTHSSGQGGGYVAVVVAVAK